MDGTAIGTYAVTSFQKKVVLFLAVLCNKVGSVKYMHLMKECSMPEDCFLKKRDIKKGSTIC
jgi:hypothetical protein